MSNKYEDWFFNDIAQMKKDIAYIKDNMIKKSNIVSGWRFYLALAVPTIISIIAIIRSV